MLSRFSSTALTKSPMLASSFATHFAPALYCLSPLSARHMSTRSRSDKDDEQNKNKDENIVPIHRGVVFNPIRFIPQQHHVLQERFGQYIDTHQPGLNCFVPLIDRLVYVINTENVYAVTHQEAITKDNASVRADGVFYYKIVDSKKAAYEVSDLLRSLENLVITNLRTIMGDMDLDELLNGRAKINADLKKTVGPAAQAWGVEITRVEIREVKPDYQLVQAMDKQMVAERDRRATETTAEGKRKATVLAAQAERERLENEALGTKEATIRNAEAKLEAAIKEGEARKTLADADAYAREKLADAESNAIKKISEAIQQNPGIEKYLIAQGSVDAWKNLAKSPNHKLLLFPSGASSIVTPVAAAAEMLGDKLNELVSKNTVKMKK